MVELFTYLFSGIIFGTVAGISPGPLLALVISETIKHNRTEGIKIAVAPVFTDIPIVILSTYLLSRLSEYNTIMAIIAFSGAAFILYLAFTNFIATGIQVQSDIKKPKSMIKGIVANFLSPHPYLFWLTIGGSILLKALNQRVIYAIAFFGGFYIFLIGSKVIVSLIIEKTKKHINTKWYVWIIRILGVILLIFAFLFILDGIKYL